MVKAGIWLDRFLEKRFAQGCSAVAEIFLVTQSEHVLVSHIVDCSSVDYGDGTLLEGLEAVTLSLG